MGVTQRNSLTGPMFLIDGYNLLHVLKPNRRYALDDVARLQMLELLSTFSRRKNREVICFLDGTPGVMSPGDLQRPGVRVKFCGPDEQSADRAICRYVEEAMDPHRLTVVSNDREVRSLCRREGARLISSDEFAAQLGQPSQAPSKTSARPQPPSKLPVNRQYFQGIEREMLDEVGDLDQFERDTLKDLE
ncbi:hypothetical protein EDM80_10970 [bacterium]|nr:MAG: hypothetical protein EDM80_10970 [bacterium]RIK61902.1 MAG: hypothetical protein DCC64_12090 [Planctomycetota bacterium]